MGQTAHLRLLYKGFARRGASSGRSERGDDANAMQASWSSLLVLLQEGQTLPYWTAEVEPLLLSCLSTALLPSGRVQAVHRVARGHVHSGLQQVLRRRTRRPTALQRPSVQVRPPGDRNRNRKLLMLFGHMGAACPHTTQLQHCGAAARGCVDGTPRVPDPVQVLQHAACEV